MTETISITSLSRMSDDTYSDFVTTVGYTLTLEEDGRSASKDFSMLIGSPYLTDESQFDSYNTLTEERVIEWLRMSPEYISNRSNVEYMLWQQRQTVDTTLPWNS